MTDRLHVASTYRVKWDGGWFADLHENFDDLLDDIGCCTWKEYTSEEQVARIGIEKGDGEKLEEYIKNLLKNPDDKNKIMSQPVPWETDEDRQPCVTNGQVAEVLQKILDLYDKNSTNFSIILSWL